MMTLPHGSMAIGTIQRFKLMGNDKHPWHIHVNSFQLSGRGLHSSTSQLNLSTLCVIPWVCMELQ